MNIYKVYQYNNDDLEIEQGYYPSLDKAVLKWDKLVNETITNNYKFNYEVFKSQGFYYIMVNGEIYGVVLIEAD